MNRLRVPLLVNAIYHLILGVSALSASIVLIVFDYAVKDTGALLVASAAFLGLGVVLLGIANDPEKHGALVTPVVIALIIFIVYLIWGWATHVFTTRNVIAPIAIDLALVVWMWSAREQS